jgi:hypothetical protein
MSRGTHYVSGTKPNRLMLFRETVAFYCENSTENIYTLWSEFSVFKKVVRIGTTSI